MSLMTKEQILAKRNKLPRQEVVTPDGNILVRGMTSLEYGQYMDEMIIGKGINSRFRFKYSRAYLMMLGCINLDGSQIFTESDIGKLNDMPASISEPIARAILTLSGMTTEAQEELEKNLLKTQTEDSGSGSPDTSAGA